MCRFYSGLISFYFSHALLCFIKYKISNGIFTSFFHLSSLMFFNPDPPIIYPHESIVFINAAIYFYLSSKANYWIILSVAFYLMRWVLLLSYAWGLCLNLNSLKFYEFSGMQVNRHDFIREY